jgi:enamine deaminase RidA (YjgF/YER057c/UK114 family)
MSNLRLVRSANLRHADYADAAVVPGDSEVLFLAGACPLDADGAVVGLGDVAAQTRKALENMDEALRQCEALLEDVAFIRVLVASDRSEDLGAAWAVVREHFGAHEVPGTLQGVTVLGYSGQLVEIEPVAARGPR